LDSRLSKRSACFQDRTLLIERLEDNRGLPCDFESRSSNSKAKLVAALHLDVWATLLLETIMKTIHKVAMASAVAFSAFAFVAMASSAAQAGPIVPQGTTA
jgi:hypothetical protein